MVRVSLGIRKGGSEPTEAPLLGKRAGLAEDDRDVRVADLDRGEELGNPGWLDVASGRERQDEPSPLCGQTATVSSRDPETW